MPTYEIIISAQDYDTAANQVAPLGGQSIHLSTEDDARITIIFEPLSRNRGLEQTTIEVIGALQLGGFAIGVASGLIANWIWAKLIKDKSTSCPMTLKVVFFNTNKNKMIELNLTSEKSIQQSLETGFKEDSTHS